MSDMYLILRRRLEDVADWSNLGTDTLKNARKARGWSYETMGRKLNVAAKTWERWEKAGHVPRHEVQRIAEMLDLEVEFPERQRVTVSEPPSAAAADVADLSLRLAELEATVEDQGRAMTTALRSLAADVRKLGRQLEPQARPATRGRAAR